MRTILTFCGDTGILGLPCILLLDTIVSLIVLNKGPTHNKSWHTVRTDAVLKTISLKIENLYGNRAIWF